MKFLKLHLISIYLSIIIFILMFTLNIQSLVIGEYSFSQNQIREFFLGISFILLMWGASRLEWFRDQAPLNRLKFLGIFMLVLWGGIKFLKHRAAFRLSDYYEINFMSVQFLEHMFWITVFLFVFILSILIFISLKELIHIQQGKKTERNFRFILIFIILHMIYIMVGGKEREILSSRFDIWYGSSILENPIYVFVVFFSFINGFRSKWIHYLTKNQKLIVLFSGALIYPCAISLVTDSSGTIQNYSLIIRAFMSCLFIFYLVYSSMALLWLLFQLPSAGLMDRRIREIQSLQTLSATIGSVLNIDELISKTTELSQEIVKADYSWLELKENSAYRIAGTQGISTEEIEQIPKYIRNTIRKEVISGKEAFLINNLLKDRGTKEINKWKLKAGSLLAARVRVKKKELGILYALKCETFGFVDESRGLFQAFADQVAVAFENVNLVQVTIEQERYREELRLAHEAQMRLLPQEMPVVKGMELGGFCMTANDIGGDLYDVFTVDKSRIDIVVGDVSGKGASAAFYMAELKGVIQSLAQHFSSPKDIIIEINTFIRKNFEQQMFVTMVYGIFLPVKRKIQIVRAGHPPTGLIRKKAVSWIETKGLGLGLTTSNFLSKSLEEKVLNLKKGDTIVFYTDGIVEARNDQDEEYGEELLTESLLNLQGLGSEEMLDEIRKRMVKFTRGVSQHDDMTVVVLKVTS